jgi:hypothetical protein
MRPDGALAGTPAPVSVRPGARVRRLTLAPELALEGVLDDQQFGLEEAATGRRGCVVDLDECGQRRRKASTA